MKIQPKVHEIIKGFTGDINGLDFAAHSYRLATASSRLIRVWVRKNGQYHEVPYSPLQYHNYGVNDLRFSPRGTMLVSSSTDGTSVIWDMKDGRILCSFIQPTRVGIRVCRFSPNSSLLATGGDDDTLCVWDIATRTLVSSFKDHDGTVFTADFTPDSGHIITGDAEGSLRLWDASSGHKLCLAKQKEAHDLGVMTSDFSKNTDRLDSLINEFLLATGGNDDVVKIWQVFTGMKHEIRHKSTFRGHEGTIMCVRFSPKGKLIASCSGDKTVRLWDVTLGTCLSVLSDHDRFVSTCAFSDDGLFLATGSNDRRVLVWDLLGRSEAAIDARGHSTSPVEDVQRKLVSQRQSDIQILGRLIGHTSDVNGVAFVSPDHVITCSGDKSVRIWCLDGAGQWMPERKIESHNYAVNAIAFCPETGFLASSSSDGKTVIYSMQTHEKIGVLTVRDNVAVRTCRFSADGKYLITAGDDDQAHIWDTRNMRLIRSLAEHEGTIYAACFAQSDPHLIITGCALGFLRLWNLSNLPAVPLFPESSKQIIEDSHDLGVNGCDIFWSEGMEYEYLITGGNDSLVRTWKLNLQRRMLFPWKSLSGHGSSIMSVHFAPKGDVFASTSGDKTVRIWDAYSFQVIHVLESHGRYVTCCGFSSDGRRLVTGSNDKSAIVWALRGVEEPVENGNKFQCRQIGDWSVTDVSDWLASCEMKKYISTFRTEQVTGPTLLRITSENLSRLGVSTQDAHRLLESVQWYRFSQQSTIGGDDSTPNEFICPITHDVMRDPVQCSDGFVYERAAIEEWFVSRRKTSPMTNLDLSDVTLVPQEALRKNIESFVKSRL